MAKRTIGMLGVVILVIGVIAGAKFYALRRASAIQAAATPPPATVAAVTAAESVWRQEFHAVGSLAAAQGVTISNQLAGTVVRIAFDSGQHVQPDDLLVQMDISTDEAQLRGLEAQAELDRLGLARARELRVTNTNAQADLDMAEAEAAKAAANVDNQRALIAKKTIRAPFAGRLGIRTVNVGQYLAEGTAIVSLESFDPIYVNLTLPEQDIADLRVGQSAHVTVEALPGETFDGTINAVNAKIDDATHNIQVQATIANPHERLVPGMFARAEIALPKEDRFVTLPATAVVYNPYGNAVYVIESAAKSEGKEPLVARQRFVQLGDTRGDQVAVIKGVQPGDRVVTAGQLKLRNGSPVQIDNSVQVSNDPAPHPPNT